MRQGKLPVAVNWLACASYGLSQAELGEIDPASETMKMATLGLRGVATNILWTKANRYKRTESWDKLSATLNQIAKLQPNYISVWEFQAHNLSYNISAEFDNYRHRYEWVKRGIEFLVEGTHYNERSPRLFWNLGWFLAHKIGIADEKEQFRRLYRTDTQFHQVMKDEEIEIDNRARFNGFPDNWLTAYLWYEKSEEVLERGVPLTWMPVNVNAQGYTDKRRSSLIYYSDPPLALIGHAEAVTDEYTPGEKTQKAWSNAGDEWDSFGAMDVPTTWGHTLRLNSLDYYTELKETMLAKLDALDPGLRERIRQRKLEEDLTPEERVAWENTRPEEELSGSDAAARANARRKLDVSSAEVAEEVPEDKRVQARSYAIQAVEANAMAERISAYRMQVNYDYWITRSRVEADDTTAAVRCYMRQAGNEADALNPEGARELFEKAWDEWAKILEAHPQLEGDLMHDELEDAFIAYKRVLDQLDEEFKPSEFKLQRLIDMYADENSPLPRSERD